mgnify:CR=1 FL=1
MPTENVRVAKHDRAGRADRQHRCRAAKIRANRTRYSDSSRQKSWTGCTSKTLPPAAATRLRRRGSRPVTRFRVMEAPLAKLDASTAWCIGQMNGCAANSKRGREPASGGKDLGRAARSAQLGAPMKARADEVDGGHRLSRRVMMSSGSRHATWLGLTAIGVRQGRCRRTAAQWSRCARIFVPADAVTLVDSWNVIGLRGDQQRRLPKVDGLFVTQRRHLGLPGASCPT